MALKINDLFGPINNIIHKNAIVNGIKELFGLSDNAREGNINLGETGSGINTIQFNRDSDVDCSIAQLQWNDEDGTLDFGLLGGNVCVQLGQERVLLVKNVSGGTITNGQACIVTNAQDDRPSVVLADASALGTATATGVATEEIEDDALGYITTAGLVRDVDTSSFVTNFSLWVSATTPGGLTMTRPTAPDLSCAVARTIKVHATEGIIAVNTLLLPPIALASDILYKATPADGDILVWVAANGRFEYQQP